MSTSKYQPEIDGIRAIAVISVVLFHALFPHFDGGFVGVDIFFVVSGFLITGIVKNSIDAGSFSYSEFYLRRARRLFPALYVTLVFTFILAALFFTPSQLERMGGSLISSVVWLSNFFFWSESGYFDHGAYMKPLLHTWSLSVEEQFYLIWPTTLYLCLSRPAIGRWFPLILLALIIASLSWGEAALESDPSAAFYLPFSRIAEFGMGASLVWLVRFQPKSLWTLEPILILALALILYSVVAFDRKTVFPGLNALIPCTGAALAIYACRARYCGWLLRNQLAVRIGLISYSLYLVHWPITVFVKYWFTDFIPPLKVMVVLLSFVAAHLLHRFVETPFRRPAEDKALSPLHYALVCLLLSISIMTPAYWVWTHAGWPSRWGAPETLINALANVEESKQERKRFVWKDETNNQAAFDKSSSKIRLLLVGDSHSTDVFNAIFLNKDLFRNINLRNFHFDEKCLYLFAKSPLAVPRTDFQKCQSIVEQFKTSELTRTADWILFSARWGFRDLQYIEDFSNYVNHNTRAQLAVMGRTAEFYDVPTLAWRNRSLDGLADQLAKHRDRSLDDLNQRLRKATLQSGAVYLDKLGFICSADTSRCDALDGNKRLLYPDYGHWTLEGAKHFGKKMARQKLLAPLGA